MRMLAIAPICWERSPTRSHSTCALIELHHAAMLHGDAATAMQLRDETSRLAVKLSNCQANILADSDSTGNIVDCKTRAKEASVPLLDRSFEIACVSKRVEIEINGIFDVAWNVYHWLGFSAGVLEFGKPLLCETATVASSPAVGARIGTSSPRK